VGEEENDNMLIGVISDIHDNIWALEKVLAELSGCTELLCLGDLCSPFTVAMIGERFDGAVHIVWGNNDGDKLAIGRNAAKYERMILHGDLAEVELGGRTIAMTHYPHIAKALAYREQYDLVCYGHNHARDKSWAGRTLLLNPGEVMGRFGVCSFAIYDTARGDAQIVEM